MRLMLFTKNGKFDGATDVTTNVILDGNNNAILSFNALDSDNAVSVKMSQSELEVLSRQILQARFPVPAEGK